MSQNLDSQTDQAVNSGQTDQNGGAPIVFLREASLFGDRKPDRNEWLKHTELYGAIATVIDATHITGLQRVNGMWRIYIDNLEDKVALLNEGVVLRGKRITLLRTNPNRLDSEQTIRIRIKNIPLSADDGILTRPLILKGIDIITSMREKLRYNGRLTNCETGDRLFTVKATSLTAPLPRFMTFGKFVGRVIHTGQATETKSEKCRKCLEDGHSTKNCPNDWKCTACSQFGHKRGDCNMKADDPPTVTAQDVARDQSAVGGNEPISKAASAEEIPAETENTHPRKKGKKNRKKEKQADPTDGQQLIDKYVVHSTDTPNKGRQPKVTDRSPPTPSETLNDKSKKARTVSGKDSDSESPGSSDED